MRKALGEKIMACFSMLRPKTYSYLTNDNEKNKTEKEKTQNRVSKTKT